jgi:hypothetical protein
MKTNSALFRRLDHADAIMLRGAMPRTVDDLRKPAKPQEHREQPAKMLTATIGQRIAV